MRLNEEINRALRLSEVRQVAEAIRAEVRQMAKVE